VDVLEVELAVPASVRAAASEYLEKHDALSILVNNAGVMACPLTRTAEGWEMQFATNHIGHFLLTCLLAPALKAGAPARVVNLTSAGHRLSNVDFDDPHFETREYDKWVSYGQSKTANVLFSVELTKRLRASGILSNAVHPGVIQTELGRHLTQQDIDALIGQNANELKFKTIQAGAATSIWAAVSPDLEARGGLYLEDCHIADAGESAFGGGGVEPYAVDGSAAARLWELTEKMLGQKFDLA
jgi:NAD(P)-dependent dehydrogenase (short-subunit alcohol dehydrogenase family)